MKRNRWMILLRILPLVLCAGFTVWYFLSGRNLDVEALRQMIQTDYCIVTVLLCCMVFALKSLTVFFPITVLYILDGCLFSPTAAVLVSMLGTAVCFTVPYWMGRFSGSSTIEKITIKYPKAERMVEQQRHHHVFVSFFLRVIHCLPGDLVSMYLGALRLPYWKFLLGSLLGAAPAFLTETLIGTSVQKQNWEMLVWSIGASLGVAVISTVFYVIYQKKQGKKQTSC